MSLPVVLKDGHGSGHRLKINEEGEVSVVIQSHPPRNEVFESYPFTTYFENSLSNDMRVDGSSIPVEFSVTANPNHDIFIKTISVFISDPGSRLDEFGNLNELANGVSFEYKNNDIGSVLIQDSIKTNLDFIRLCTATPGHGDGPRAFLLDISGSGGADSYLPVLDIQKTFGFTWGLRLKKGSKDKLSFIVNDDLSRGMTAFNIKAFGTQL
jgi:hypothetical protein